MRRATAASPGRAGWRCCRAGRSTRRSARLSSDFLWRDLPGALLPDGMAPEVVGGAAPVHDRASGRCRSRLPGGPLRLLGWHATPPVFDGPEDRNGRRNHDEAAFWLRSAGRGVPGPRDTRPLRALGRCEPRSGARRRASGGAARAAGAFAGAGRGAAGGGRERQRRISARTADRAAMRVDYVLPSAALRVTGAGVIWPEPGDPLHAVAEAASRHRLVWVDVALPGAP